MSFPKELLELKQWVCWRLTPGQKGEKDRKVPFDPKTCKPASTNKPATWSDYSTARAAQEKYGFTGLGFVFVKDCGIVGVDIDNCYDPESRAFNEVARAVLDKQPTYAEFSPSGKGVHLFFKGSLPAGGGLLTREQRDDGAGFVQAGVVVIDVLGQGGAGQERADQ